MQIVDLRFQGVSTVFCGVVEAHRQDNHLETDQHRTVQRHPATVSPPARDVDHHLRPGQKREVHRTGSAGWSEYQPLRLAQGGQPFRDGEVLPHHDQHIAALQADKLASARLKPVRFITYAGRPIRLNNRAVYSARDPSGGADTRSPPARVAEQVPTALSHRRAVVGPRQDLTTR